MIILPSINIVSLKKNEIQSNVLTIEVGSLGYWDTK